MATVGRPPTRVRAATRPSLVPMTMSSRMNSARAANTWTTSRPPGVQVLVEQVKPIPRSRSSATMLMRSWRLRPPRSSESTTKAARVEEGVARLRLLGCGGEGRTESSHQRHPTGGHLHSAAQGTGFTR
ncbi:hypothetical protein VR46_44060, partial [Streptomyces sp. NRRL S-444]